MYFGKIGLLPRYQLQRHLEKWEQLCIIILIVPPQRDHTAHSRQLLHRCHKLLSFLLIKPRLSGGGTLSTGAICWPFSFLQSRVGTSLSCSNLHTSGHVLCTSSVLSPNTVSPSCPETRDAGPSPCR